MSWAAAPAPASTPRLALALALLAALTTLATNQVFHGGLWGPLHNDSVRPRVDTLSGEIDAAGRLRREIERPVGPETYGAFLVALRVFDEGGALVRDYDAQTLAATAPADIDNRWLVAVQTGPHGLVVPLGGRATVSLPTLPRAGALAPGRYRVEWEDVSGARWSSDLALEPMAAGSGPRSARLERN
ncbi:TQO small subunit DoxA domain-containing protein [Haliangium ochraceum]|uniref:TQO small subunit DoxA domain-containing protein n=1 Tax=Haliangium ochraceum TaxID=80816 RepID=UPI00019BAB1B|nr:TQO small subunit DoxA domain-containing protein [Haliangium ochraceum]